MPPRLPLLLVVFALAGCADDNHPVWAFDPIYVEPTDEGVYALQTWELFANGWQRGHGKRHYICGVVRSLRGPEDETACEGCEQSWTVTSDEVETDCSDFIAEEVSFPIVTGLGRGPLPEGLASDSPYPDTEGGFVQYDSGPWVSHGWAYAEAWDSTGTAEPAGWDDSQAFVFWPAFAWEIRQE